MSVRGLLVAVFGMAALAVPAWSQEMPTMIPAEVAGTPEMAPGGRFGDVRMARPAGPMRGFVMLFSAMSGWSDADQAAADALAREGILVIGVDTARYAASLGGIQEACHSLYSDVEVGSRQFERALQSTAYFTPIVAGTGEGGTLAERILALAPENTIAGAASIDPAATLDARFNPCPPDQSILHDPSLPGFWDVGATAALPEATQARVAELHKLGAQVEVQSFARDTAEADILLALTRGHLRSHAADDDDVSDLPLVELPAEHVANDRPSSDGPGNMLAIVVSGDGGWRDLDQTIAHSLQERGVSTVGVDSLRYFWNRKTPSQTAHDLARVIETYSRRWRAKSVALIGYSFGADVLPFVYNRLPGATRGKVKLVSLLGLSEAADFELRVVGWLGLPPSAEALPERPEVIRLPPELVQCFYGEGETDSLCPDLAKTGMATIRTDGGHHFGHDYEHLAQVILSGWRRRMTKG